MAELSERFAALMARLAQTDADLFRTLGEQNSSVRQLLEELAPSGKAPAVAAGGDAAAAADAAHANASLGTASPNAALAPAPLLPATECELKALKRRFGRLDQAQAWLEERLGQAPKKPTWAVVEQTCRAGAWPVNPGRQVATSRGLSADALEQRLMAMEERLLRRLEPRLLRLEALLTRLTGAVDQPPPAEPLTRAPSIRS